MGTETKPLVDRRCLTLTAYCYDAGPRKGDVFHITTFQDRGVYQLPPYLLGLQRIVRPICELGPQPAELPTTCQWPEAIRALYQQSRELVEQAMSARDQADRAVAEFQASCFHDWQGVTADNPDFVWGGRAPSHLFVGHACPKCLAFERRKSGDKTTVCEACGGDMKYEGCLPDQDRTRIHVCLSCGHRVETT